MRADSGGVGIEYDVSGPEDGRPVVLVHGFPDTGRLWRNQVPALAEAGLRVIVPDMRGYGRSDKPADIEAYNLLFLAGDVFAVLDDLGIERAAIVGHDWGAAVAGVSPRWDPIGSNEWLRCRSGIPQRSGSPAFRSRRSPGTCCCSNSLTSQSGGSARTGGRTFGNGATIPMSTA